MLVAYEKFVDRITSASAWAGMICVVWMVGHIVLEIILRNFFSRSTFVLEEFVGYATAATTFFGLAAALRDGELIRVGLLLENVGPIFRRIIETFSSIVALLTMTFLGVFVARIILRNFERGRTSTSLLETPLWIPQSLIMIGIIVFCLQISVYLIKSMSGTLPPVLKSQPAAPISHRE